MLHITDKELLEKFRYLQSDLRDRWECVEGDESDSSDVDILVIPSIIATKGVAKINLSDVEPPLTRHNYKLFARDRHMCAYCGEVFPERKLTREHIFSLKVFSSSKNKNIFCFFNVFNTFLKDSSLSYLTYSLLIIKWFMNFFLESINTLLVSNLLYKR